MEKGNFPESLEKLHKKLTVNTQEYSFISFINYLYEVYHKFSF